MKSKTRFSRASYAVTGPLDPVPARVARKFVTRDGTTGRAVVEVARPGLGRRGPEASDIDDLRRR